MTHKKWLTITLFLILLFAALVVVVNLCVDHHAVRLSLFSGQKEIHQTTFPHGINQHIFNPELIFRNPQRFDCFLFGSSRTSQIDVGKIIPCRFYNMSYNLGQPAHHLAILKAFLKRGIKIKAVLIGLDDFCFNLSPLEREEHLISVMHPDSGGPGRLKIFMMYFFRKPERKELSQWKDRVLLGRKKGTFILNSEGVMLGWSEKDQFIEKSGKPIFNFAVNKYEPNIYNQKDMNGTFAVIEELIGLAHDHHFALTFFLNPFYAQKYINNAESLFIVKERLAKLTDFYDFSGFNSVTTDAMNYLEESHYRLRVGDMITGRIFSNGKNVPDGFGMLVTRQNVASHLEKQKTELDQYLKRNHLQ